MKRQLALDAPTNRASWRRLRGQYGLAAGIQVTIYDPDRDPDGAAGRRLAGWLVDLLSP